VNLTNRNIQNNGKGNSYFWKPFDENELKMDGKIN
jgi:hypothetical protein